jgi:hypothetical protein
MRDFINAATASSAGVTASGVGMGQLVVAIVGLILMAAFGAWGAYWKYRDSKAIREAIEAGDLKGAILRRNK